MGNYTFRTIIQCERARKWCRLFARKNGKDAAGFRLLFSLPPPKPTLRGVLYTESISPHSRIAITAITRKLFIIFTDSPLLLLLVLQLGFYIIRTIKCRFLSRVCMCA